MSTMTLSVEAIACVLFSSFVPRLFSEEEKRRGTKRGTSNSSLKTVLLRIGVGQGDEESVKTIFREFKKEVTSLVSSIMERKIVLSMHGTVKFINILLLQVTSFEVHPAPRML